MAKKKSRALQGIEATRIEVNNNKKKKRKKKQQCYTDSKQKKKQRTFKKKKQVNAVNSSNPNDCFNKRKEW